MKKRKKYFGIIKKYAYLISIVTIFSAMGIGAFTKNMAAGRCNWNYIKTHLTEPFWEGMFQTETEEICAKEEDEKEKIAETVKMVEQPE